MPIRCHVLFLWERMAMNINPEGSILYVLALMEKKLSS